MIVQPVVEPMDRFTALVVLLLFVWLHSSDPRHSPGQSLAEERHRSQLRIADVLGSRCWRIQVEQRHGLNIRQIST